jgi:hypothetical protein
MKFNVLLQVFTLVATPSFLVHAEEKRIYQTDTYGNIQYNKPSYTVKSDGRILETDVYGNKLFNHQQYQIKGDKIYQRDAVGNIQFNKPQFTHK